MENFPNRLNSFQNCILPTYKFREIDCLFFVRGGGKDPLLLSVEKLTKEYWPYFYNRNNVTEKVAFYIKMFNQNRFSWSQYTRQN